MLLEKRPLAPAAKGREIAREARMAMNIVLFNIVYSLLFVKYMIIIPYFTNKSQESREFLPYDVDLDSCEVLRIC